MVEYSSIWAVKTKTQIWWALKVRAGQAVAGSFQGPRLAGPVLGPPGLGQPGLTALLCPKHHSGLHPKPLALNPTLRISEKPPWHAAPNGVTAPRSRGSRWPNIGAFVVGLWIGFPFGVMIRAPVRVL